MILIGLGYWFWGYRGGVEITKSFLDFKKVSVFSSLCISKCSSDFTEQDDIWGDEKSSILTKKNRGYKSNPTQPTFHNLKILSESPFVNMEDIYVDHISKCSLDSNEYSDVW